MWYQDLCNVFKIGQAFLLEITCEPEADRPTDEEAGDEGDEDFEFVHERASF